VREHRDTSLLSAAAFLLAGPILWAAHLFLVYGPQSALCAMGRPDGPVTMLVLLVTAVFAVPLAVLLAAPGTAVRLLRLGTEDRRFSVSVMRWLSALSLAGVLLAGAAALLVDPCAQLR
jgi:hypothetical protein